MDRPPEIFPPGKVPADVLARLLPSLSSNDPRVLIGPRVGTDAAVIDMGSTVLVVKSDPITFPTDDAGWYLVNVNANDIACMGGVPKWLLVTALLPESSTTEALVEDLFASLQRACKELNIELVGGHTEITIGIDRPILVGSMLGETSRERLIDPTSVDAGDALLLCKGIAIEGTSILAIEADSQALNAVPEDVLVSARRFLEHPGISVVAAANALIESGVTVRAFHDPTEGGLATALREIAEAASLGIDVELDDVRIYPETQHICDALGLDPLGLIASGALLAAVPADQADAAAECLARNNITCTRIGTFTEPDAGIVARRNGQVVPLPVFEVDEIARYFSNT